MIVRLVLLLIFPAIFIFPETGSAQDKERDPCKYPKVQYERFEKDSYGFDKITLTKMNANEDVPVPADSIGRTRTSMGTRWFAEDEPDFMKPGPWNTRVYIGDKAGLTWSMKFANHSSYGVKVNWINENLLFAQVWWGRIVSTDMIFDAETGKYLYRRQANYGEVIMNCPDSTQKQN